MITPKNNIAAAIFFVVAALSLSACNKESESSKAAVPAAPAAVAPASSDLPDECEAYIKTVEVCVSKLGANNPGAEQFKQSMDMARSQWSSMGGDKSQLAASCKQASDQFKQVAGAMGCN